MEKEVILKTKTKNVIEILGIRRAVKSLVPIFQKPCLQCWRKSERDRIIIAWFVASERPWTSLWMHRLPTHHSFRIKTLPRHTAPVTSSSQQSAVKFKGQSVALPSSKHKRSLEYSKQTKDRQLGGLSTIQLTPVSSALLYQFFSLWYSVWVQVRGKSNLTVQGFKIFFSFSFQLWPTYFAVIKSRRKRGKGCGSDLC